MNHICKCGTIMEKTQRTLMVHSSHIRRRADQSRYEGEKIDDGIVPKNTSCYICPKCGNFVFYGYNYKYKPDEIVQ